MKQIVSCFLLGIGWLFGVSGFGQSEVEWVVEPSLEFEYISIFFTRLACNLAISAFNLART